MKAASTRRTFITGAGIATAAAMAASGLARADEPSQANQPTMEADVVVIGAGFGGLIAAASALDAGASVIVIEASTRVGSSSLLCSGVMTTHGSNSVAELAANAPLTDERLGQAFLDAWQPALDWLDAIGAPLAVEMRETDSGSYPIYRLGAELAPRGNVIYADFLESYVRDHGAQIVLSTRAKKLRMDDDGTVTGVVCHGPEGIVTVGAKEVILACGGTQNNKEMNVQYISPYADLMVSRGNPHNTGIGLILAKQAGGVASRSHGTFYGHPVPYGAYVTEDCDLWDQNIVDDQWLADVNAIFTVAQNSGAAWGIVINLDGERFFDESQDDLLLNQAIAKQKFARAYEVVDASIREAHTGMSATAGIENIDLLKQWGVEVLEGQTIEELADALAARGVTRSNFLRTVAEYNDAIDQGAVSELNIPKKNESKAEKIADGPFYAFAVVPGYSFSFGGVKTDLDGRVVDAVDDPIPGLWAIPGTAGGMQYDTYIGVISTMTAMGHKAGDLAGQAACAHA